jgi:thiol-disulfide isomerase/thioredoxin
MIHKTAWYLSAQIIVLILGGPLLGAEPEGDDVAEIAERFFAELRSQDREAARQTLTTRAQELMQGAQSPLAGLPSPEAGRRTIRVGRAKLDGTMAEIPVQVRAGGRMHKTKLHLRHEDDRWRVFALSATYPDGEKSINFEAELAAGGDSNVDPLAGLVAKPFELSGLTIDARRLDMSQYEGKIVLVDFWATWCGPCRAEIPNILANFQKHHNDGFDVIAVSVDQDIEALKTFVGTEKPPWAVVVDNYPGNRNSMAARYGIRAIPAFILVGQDGKVAAVNCRGKQLGQELARLTARGGQGPKVGSVTVKRLR